MHVKCPNCGAEIQLDESKENGFCLYCGSSVIVKDAINLRNVSISGKVEVDGIATIEKLLLRGKQFFNQDDYEKADEYFNRVLDIDPANEEALKGLSGGTIIVNGAKVSHDISENIIYIAKSGEKIKAIKLLYDSTGSELAHSKAYIELLILNDYNIAKTNQEYKKVSTTVARKSGCYIATAVYGSYDAYEVRILRKFRDETLAKTIFGRLFIAAYYYLSPSVSQKLSKNGSVSYLVRKCIDKVVARLPNV